MKYSLLKSGLNSKNYTYNKTFQYDKELDDISSLSSDIANALCDLNYKFNLSLNGKIIPVEIWGDLPYFIDGFSDYMKFIFVQKECQYDYSLSEQGTETIIKLQLNEEDVMISEDNFLKGKYAVPIKELQDDALLFFTELLKVVQDIIPNILLTDLFKSWEEEVRDSLKTRI
ncbi:hypothetical protein [Chondrinema litorale]|uniref:hypothetical protein n=1 Tax=Chondrinema litorale TaxID=2994555 RepID=UPI002542C40C|nr:hypothetical protein [Chondrinema litorale]UZR97686.1 hypothetical protein OQ292_28175 [Chondrinema litorale]